MSVNGHLPHVLVLPEDDANRQLANGFVLDLDQAFLTQSRCLRWQAAGPRSWSASSQTKSLEWAVSRKGLWFC